MAGSINDLIIYRYERASEELENAKGEAYLNKIVDDLEPPNRLSDGSFHTYN